MSAHLSLPLAPCRTTIGLEKAVETLFTAKMDYTLSQSEVTPHHISQVGFSVPDSQIIEPRNRFSDKQQIYVTEAATPLIRQNLLGKRLRKETMVDCLEESLEATNESSFNRSLECASDKPAATSAKNNS